MNLALPALVGLLGLIGAAYGSFGNVLILRLPDDRTIGGRSACPRCQRTLRAHELVPIVSYLWQRGRCRGCRMRISAQYPLVEAASAALAVSSLWLTPDPLQAIPLGLGLCTMLFASFTDLRTQTIPDLLLLLLCTFGLLTTLLSPSPTLWGGLVAGGFFAAQWLISRGRWIGSGDIALGLGLGLMVGGVREGIMLLLAAYILGAIITSVGLVSGRLTRHDSVAFGPFLGLGALVTLWGSPLTLTWLAQRGL